jgi:hypothetical protein
MRLGNDSLERAYFVDMAHEGGLGGVGFEATWEWIQWVMRKVGLLQGNLGQTGCNVDGKGRRLRQLLR